MHLQFVQSESTIAFFNATQRYLEAHGNLQRDVVEHRVSQQPLELGV